jgi:hypothetical protein
MANLLKRFTVLLTVFFGVLPFEALAHLYFNIEACTPRGGQRGTTVEVLLEGTYLDDPREIIFYRPGIRAVDFEVLPPHDPPLGLHGGGKIQDRVRCKFVIAPDCPLGEHPLRLRTKNQLTNLTTFYVSPWPIVKEVEPANHANNVPEKAETIPVDVTVHGQLHTPGPVEVDCYRVPVVAGSRLSLALDCVCIADKRYAHVVGYDLKVRVLDEAGHELGSNDDNDLRSQDPLLSIVSKYDGYVTVEVSQSMYFPVTAPYLLHVGTQPFPLAAVTAYPLGGRAGEKLNIKLLGDVAGPTEQSIDVPVQTGTFPLSKDLPYQLRLRSSTFPNVLEATDSEEVRVDALPIALNGVIATPGDTDTFRLLVKKTDRLQVRVFAATLGTALDAAITIRNAQTGEVEIKADDATYADRDLLGIGAAGGGRPELLDPSVIWQPKADGEYLLTVSDGEGHSSERSIYRIEIQAAREKIDTLLQDLHPHSVDYSNYTSLAVPQGNRWSLKMTMRRFQGTTYSGDLQLVAHGLPAGVHFSAPIVRQGQNDVPVLFTADPTAVPGTALISIEAKAVDPNVHIESGSSQNFRFLNYTGGDAYHFVDLDRYALAVTDPAPLSLEVTAPNAPLVLEGELAIPFQIVRRDGFNDEVEVIPSWVPPGVAALPVIVPAGASEGVMRFSADPKATVGAWPLMLYASPTTPLSPLTGAGRIRVSSRLIDLQIAEPFVKLTTQAASVRRGETVKMKWNVEHRHPFEGEAEVILLGLPKGVTMLPPAPKIRSTDNVLTFEIAASDEALLGRSGELGCEIRFRIGGQDIRQRNGRGMLRIDPARPASKELSAKAPTTGATP